MSTGHKVNIEMENTGLVKNKLPLYDFFGKKGKDNKVLCSTCHDPHTWGWNPTTASFVPAPYDDVEGTTQNSFLRRTGKSTDNLCSICHKNESIMEGTVHDLGLRKGENKDRGLCEICHSVHNPKYDVLLWDYAFKEGNDETVFAQRICFNCHNKKKLFGTEKKKRYNHPINQKVTTTFGKEKVRTTLPLYTDAGEKDNVSGKIVCFTCHDIHRWNPKSVTKKGGFGIEGETSNSFLRVSANDGYLCTNCHEKKISLFNTEHDLRDNAPFEENLKGLIPEESGPCGVCHVSHNASKESVFLWNRRFGKDVNKLTALCKSCHADGKCAEAKQTELNYHIPQDHTIITYGKQLIFMNIQQFTNTSGILSETNLPLYSSANEEAREGFLQCISCHDPHKWSANPYMTGTGKPEEGDISNSFLRLQIPEQASKTLCVSCHANRTPAKYEQFHLPKPASEIAEDAAEDYDSYDDYDEDYDYDYDTYDYYDE